MHLADRRGGERLLVEGDEDLLERRAEARLDDLLDLLERDGRDVVLELLQLGDDVGRQEIVAASTRSDRA